MFTAVLWLADWCWASRWGQAVLLLSPGWQEFTGSWDWGEWRMLRFEVEGLKLNMLWQVIHTDWVLFPHLQDGIYLSPRVCNNAWVWSCFILFYYFFLCLTVTVFKPRPPSFPSAPHPGKLTQSLGTLSFVAGERFMLHKPQARLYCPLSALPASPHTSFSALSFLGAARSPQKTSYVSEEPFHTLLVFVWYFHSWHPNQNLSGCLSCLDGVSTKGFWGGLHSLF